MLSWRRFAPILGIHFLGTLGFSLAIPFLVFIVTELGGASWTYGLLGATYSAFQLLGAPLLGRWSDRTGRRPVLVASQVGTLSAWLLFLVALDLPDTLLSLILGYVCITLPFCLWLMWAFFRGVPIEIEEAALVDGATRLQVFRQVVLPVALPGIIAASIFSLIVSWNDYLFGRVFMNSMDKLPLTVGVMHFFDGTHVDWGLMMASSVLMTLPMAILFGFMQRHLVAGFGAGAVKG